MTKSTTGLLLSVLLIPAAGCSYVSDFNQALPDVDDLELSIPDMDSLQAAGKAVAEQGEGGDDVARCASHSHHLTQRVNEDVRRVLSRLDEITSHRPTETDGDTAIYMPPEQGKGGAPECEEGEECAPPEGEGRPEGDAGAPPEGEGRPPMGEECAPPEGGEGQGPEGEAGKPPPPKGPQRLVVTEAADGSYRYAFQVAAEEGGPWLDHIVGRVDAGSTREAGSGLFQVNFDVMADLAPEDAPEAGRSGAISFAYLFSAEGARAIDVEMKNLSDPEGGVMSGNLFLDQGEDGFVSLDAARRGLDAEGASIAMANRAQWDDTRAGRCDGTFTGGDLGESVALRSQCWDGDIQEVFFSESIDGEASTRGDEGLCAFDAASVPSL